ncbi:hypothetical protein JYU34_000767 [Plutella xylostella]|uniref:Fibrinogen C-terminal domain-containing protein n=1 Tax=Plutella xylostella TaxID=51655 RepID=A0ABQ7R8J8_PLUXY|nr:hypothetical protein JYU34_000767 [Plutella xylostella]
MSAMCATQWFILFSVLAAAASAKSLITDSDIIDNDMKTLAVQLDELKASHNEDIARLRRELEELKHPQFSSAETSHHNEQATLQWCRSALRELRSDLTELAESVSNSVLLKQMHVMRNEIKQMKTDASDLTQLARTQEARVDKLEADVGRLKYEGQTLRANSAELRALISKLSKELKKRAEYEEPGVYNDVVMEDGARMVQMKPPNGHKYRHSKMVHTQIARLARTQDQLDLYQQNLQTQILDVQKRLDRLGEPNWDLVTAKVEFLELEGKVIREQIANVSRDVSDLTKVHSSILELREDIENVENKADKTIPEFRKEISKLDVGVAQLHAQVSYMKEDQENLRQSVKAIAVSVSNTIDRAEMDRLDMQRINESITQLKSHSKQHFYRLNDHILKSEANSAPAPLAANDTQIITLPELMGEVKELQPVEREYEDLVSQLPRDCGTVGGAAGVYLIHPGRVPLDAWCSNGTTLLQRRYNGSIEFNRNFQAYADGFGDPAGEYWMGLETMHQLTADNCSSMRIDMTDIYGGAWYAQYEHFSVGDADGGYVLTVSGFKGNASDAFDYQNHMEFSAVDRDRDISNTHCAGNYEGGWWYSHCQHVNINGKYSLGLTWFDAARNEWIAVATSDMRLRRRPGCA